MVQRGAHLPNRYFIQVSKRLDTRKHLISVFADAGASANAAYDDIFRGLVLSSEQSHNPRFVSRNSISQGVQIKAE
ncbi:hypothetical protein CBOM_05347 [Ceraceosorus bombacis]|uniref:Uncharacterized protein n=1 Tax=Ceraceosorus bombacis TaxID=401625 RepID=A0A0P1BQI6_9BASI|nr:hypothetical protein CBOM_05347 [Ceraceosorus bombacis]